MTMPQLLRTLRGFNSATTFQPWKLLIIIVGTVPSSKLQFGHDLSAVETTTGGTEKVPAVMLQFGHDLSAVETVKRPQWRQCR